MALVYITLIVCVTFICGLYIILKYGGTDSMHDLPPDTPMWTYSKNNNKKENTGDK